VAPKAKVEKTFLKDNRGGHAQLEGRKGAGGTALKNDGMKM